VHTCITSRLYDADNTFLDDINVSRKTPKSNIRFDNRVGAVGWGTELLAGVIGIVR